MCFHLSTGHFGKGVCDWWGIKYKVNYIIWFKNLTTWSTNMNWQRHSLVIHKNICIENLCCPFSVCLCVLPCEFILYIKMCKIEFLSNALFVFVQGVHFGHVSWDALWDLQAPMHYSPSQNEGNLCVNMGVFKCHYFVFFKSSLMWCCIIQKVKLCDYSFCVIP